VTARSFSWATIGIAIAWALLSGQPAQADVTVGAAIWSCQNEGSDQATARLDVTRLSNLVVDEEGARLSAADEPFTCSFPWGQLHVEVTDYYSPHNNGRCGAVEVWGLKVTADGQVLEDIPSVSALACHMDDFNPFQGWVEADAEGVVVCRFDRDGSTRDCETARVEEFQGEIAEEARG
jgi:hypothetical protein